MSDTATPLRKLIVINIVWWIIVSIIHAIIISNFRTSILQIIVDSFVSYTLLAGLSIIITNNMRYYLPRQEKYWYVFIMAILASAIWIWISKLILGLIFRNDEGYHAFQNSSMPIRFGISVLSIGCMMMISLLWYTQEEQKLMNQRKNDAEKMTRQAELYKLRQQLQPHFLFNSLNSISALTGSDPEKARHMIQQLSDFLRGSLRKDENHRSTLDEELQYLELYLDIEKVRFGHRLQTCVTYDEPSLKMKLPSMLLQPIVENAIKFGLYDTIGDVVISIAAGTENNYLKVTVENPFDPETSQPLHGTGFGLASVKRRLFLLFGRQDLVTTRREDNHFITTVTIPQIQ